MLHLHVAFGPAVQFVGEATSMHGTGVDAPLGIAHVTLLPLPTQTPLRNVSGVEVKHGPASSPAVNGQTPHSPLLVEVGDGVVVPVVVVVVVVDVLLSVVALANGHSRVHAGGGGGAGGVIEGVVDGADVTGGPHS